MPPIYPLDILDRSKSTMSSDSPQFETPDSESDGINSGRLRALQQDFPWLVLQKSTGSIFCHQCVRSGLDCAFSTHISHAMLKAHEESFHDQDDEDTMASNLSLSAAMDQDQNITDHDQSMEEGIIPMNGNETAVKQEPGSDSEESCSYNLSSSFAVDVSEIADLVENTESPSPKQQTRGQKRKSGGFDRTKYKRKFAKRWLDRFKWLQYDEKTKVMYCQLCIKHMQHSTSHNSFILGNQNYKVEVLVTHAGSVDHQVAEKAERIAECEGKGSAVTAQITAKQKFIIKKYLALYPWLAYRADAQMIICELCHKHTSNTLYLDIHTDLQQDNIQRHRSLKLHLVAEETEANSWDFVWDTLLKHDVPTDFITKDMTDTRKDLERRSVSLFKNTSVKVSGTPRELEVCNEDIEMKDTEIPSPSEDVKAKPKYGDRTPRTRVRALSAVTLRNTTVKRKFGKFRPEWLKHYSWLHYDADSDMMSCELCTKHKKNTAFAKGVQAFTYDNVWGHEKLLKHKDAVEIENKLNPLKAPAEVKNGNPMIVKNNQLQSHVSPMNTIIVIPPNVQQVAPVKNNSMVKIAMKPMVTVPNQPQTDNRRMAVRSGSFNPEWENQFPWLQYSKEDNAMLCAWCTSNGASGVFTKGCRSFRVESLKQHETSTCHQQAAAKQNKAL